jgi:hypothetical protein
MSVAAAADEMALAAAAAKEDASAAALAEADAVVAPPLAVYKVDADAAESVARSEEKTNYDILSIQRCHEKEGVQSGVWNCQPYATIRLNEELKNALHTDFLAIHEDLSNGSCFFLAFAIAVYKACGGCEELLLQLPEPYNLRLKAVFRIGEGHVQRGRDPPAKQFRTLLANFVLKDASPDLENVLGYTSSIRIPMTTRNGNKSDWRKILSDNSETQNIILTK